MAGHVFFSYSRSDGAYVEAAAGHLRALGVPVWFDNTILPGESFALVIQRAIDECEAFIPVLSPAAASSKWVMREISRADELGKPMLPILREICDWPLALAGLQYEDARTGTMPSDRFVHRLRELLSQSGVVRQP